MKSIVQFLIMAVITTSMAGCGSGSGDAAKAEEEEKPYVVKKYRDDGTLSSVNPVDDKGYVHGVKVNFYEDGKTVHSKITYDHGRKQGPALWYFKNGQVHEHTSYHFGRKQGPTKTYYENGQLFEELTYEQGKVLPGKKTYDKKGNLIPE
ncbi:MAG: hypothetical protein V2B15_09090 [Bacteroidota bacterium]